MSSVFWFILTATLQVTLLSGIALLVQQVRFRNKPKAASRLLAFSSLMVLLLTAAMLLPFPSWFNVSESSTALLGDGIEAGRKQVVEQPADVVSEQFVDAESAGPQALNLPPLTWVERVKEFSQQIDAVETGNEATRLPLLAIGVRWLGAAAALFLAVGLARFIVGLIELRRLKLGSKRVASESLLAMAESLRKEIGCCRKIEIYHCKNLTTAATVGSIKPHIFLANDFDRWEQTDQKSVLAHEIAHIHHHDFEANVVSQICRTIHFFNPVVRWLTSQMRLQQELAADRVAARVTAGASEYSRTLASLALKQEDARYPIVSMFLPQKSNFIQRIKMLQKQNSDQRSSAGWLFPILIFATAIAICGVRIPASTDASPVPVAFAEGKEEGFDLTWVGEDCSVICVRPAELLKSRMFSRLNEKIGILEGAVRRQDTVFEIATGLGVEHIDEFITCSKEVAREKTYFIYRTFEDNLANFKSLGEVSGSESSFPIRIENSDDRTQQKYGLILDERTILWAYSKELVEQLRGRGKQNPSRAKWIEEFRKVKEKQVVLTFGRSELQALSGELFGPLLDKKVVKEICDCDSAVLWVNVERDADLGLVLNFPGAADAKKVDEMMPEVRKQLSDFFTGMAKSPQKINQILGRAILASIKSAKVKRTGKRLEISTKLKPKIADFAKFGDQIRKAAQRTQGMNNMRQLALAMLNYEAARGSLPSATMRHESGNEYSWRIAILPYLGQNELYERYRFDEPWDSDHNLEVTSEMPLLFKHPANDSKTDTNYFVVVGPGTLFPPKGKITWENVTDGSMRTVMLVEAVRDCHWAKPGGLPIGEALVPETLGGFTDGIIHMNMMDGSVRSVSNQISPEMLASLYSVDGGEADIVLSDLALELEPPAGKESSGK